MRRDRVRAPPSRLEAVRACAIFESADAPADPVALAALRERRRGRRPRRAARGPPGLPPQGRQGDALEHRRRHPGHDQADADVLLAELRDGARRPGHRAADARRRVTDFYGRVRERCRSRRPTAGTSRQTKSSAAPPREPSSPSSGSASTQRARPNRGGRAPRTSSPTAAASAFAASCRGRSSSSPESGSRRSGPSNHFIELQEVEEVLDAEAADALGIERGQVTLQYHGGGGALPGSSASLFGRRKRYPRPLRIQMAVQKPLYHLARARSLEQLRRRRALYFSGGFPPVERDGTEGERLMLANVMAMNYGFAFRLSAYAMPDRARCGSRSAHGESRLVVDSPHNSIYEEEIDGERGDRPPPQRRPRLPGSRMTHHPIFGRIGQAAACCRARAGRRPTSASRARARTAACTRRPTARARRSSDFARRGALGAGSAAAARRSGSAIRATRRRRSRNSTTGGSTRCSSILGTSTTSCGPWPGCGRSPS